MAECTLGRAQRRANQATETAAEPTTAGETDMNMMTSIKAASSVAAIAAASETPALFVWSNAVAEYEKARALFDATSAELQPIEQAYQEACAAIPHVASATAFDANYTENGRWARRRLSTADSEDVAEAKSMLRSSKEWGPDMDEYVAACREVIAAEEERGAEAARLYNSFGLHALGEREDAALNAYCEAMDYLINEVPAPNAAAVKMKLELALERSEDFEGLFDDHQTAILADLGRIQNPLESFAATWLARWTARGGSATFDLVDRNKIWIGQPMYDLSPDAIADEAFVAAWRENGLAGLAEDMRERCIEDRRSFDQSFWEGKMRELYDLLVATPGGVDAVKAAVRINPSAGRPAAQEA